MSSDVSEFGSVDFFNNISVLFFKVFVGFGVLIFSFYCWGNSFYPEGITLGDAILFFMISVFFGYSYSFFVVGLTCLGGFLGFIYNPAQKIVFLVIKKLYGLVGVKFNPDPLYIETPGWGGFFGAIMGGAFVYVLSQGSFERFLYMAFSSLVCAFSWSLLLKSKSTEKKIIGMSFKSEENLALRNRARAHVWLCLALIGFSPITIGEVFGDMVDASMVFAKLRYENVLIGIPENGVASVLSAKGLANDSDYRNDYVVFENADLVFHGFGSRSYILVDGYDEVFAVKREDVYFEKRSLSHVQ